MIAALKRLIPDNHPLRLAWHRGKALVAALRYGFPARGLTVIGITGTDGKTTTVGMTVHILAARGFQAAALSTAFFQIGTDRTWNATQKTSPSPFAVQRFLRRARAAGCTHVVLECSSHGLTQGRLRFTWPAVAAITNTSPEHLDYHGTMPAYRAAKAILFRSLRGRGAKVLNREDGTYPLYAAIPSERTVAYSTHPAPEVQREADLWTDDIRPEPARTRATIHHKDRQTELDLGIPGAFNVENALCAIGCAMATGIPFQDAVRALGTFQGVPGRMEPIDEGQPFSVLVDFTVTPAAYERTLATLKSALPPSRRLLVLAGSCGDRMREKRPEVGRICSAYADVFVVTNEDPYTEDPDRIMDEVMAGADPSRTDLHRIPDRREAIAFLLREARPGDAVVLCGKGSDTTMWTAAGQVPWNEREIVREMLRERRSKNS